MPNGKVKKNKVQQRRNPIVTFSPDMRHMIESMKISFLNGEITCKAAMNMLYNMMYRSSTNESGNMSHSEMESLALNIFQGEVMIERMRTSIESVSSGKIAHFVEYDINPNTDPKSNDVIKFNLFDLYDGHVDALRKEGIVMKVGTMKDDEDEDQCDLDCSNCDAYIGNKFQ